MGDRKISEHQYICIKNGIKVYPVYRDYHWYINIENNGILTKGKKKIARGTSRQNSKSINDAMLATYKYFSEKIQDEKL